MRTHTLSFLIGLALTLFLGGADDAHAAPLRLLPSSGAPQQARVHKVVRQRMLGTFVRRASHVLALGSPKGDLGVGRLAPPAEVLDLPGLQIAMTVFFMGGISSLVAFTVVAAGNMYGFSLLGSHRGWGIAGIVTGSVILAAAGLGCALLGELFTKIVLPPASLAGASLVIMGAFNVYFANQFKKRMTRGIAWQMRPWVSLINKAKGIEGGMLVKGQF